MKTLILSSAMAFVSLTTFAADNCPNFSGKYTHYTCKTMSPVDDGSSMFYWMIHNEDSAAKDYKTNPTYIIKQNGCDQINVDGQETSFGNKTNIYLTDPNFIGGEEEYRGIDLSTDKNSVDVTFQIRNVMGALPSKNRFHFTLTKQSDGSVHLVETSKSKSILTLGFFKKGSEVDCVFSP